MAQVNFVTCPQCHAEISEDREACPHCGTPVVSENANSTKLAVENAALKAKLKEKDDALAAENARLKAQLSA